jgi:uncharacterized protein (DUF302 family)
MNCATWKATAVTGVLLACGTAVADRGNAMSAPKAETPLAISTRTAQVLHRSVRIEASFERFTSTLERILGHFPSDIQRDIIEHPQLAAERLKAAEGAQELMVFSVFDHGAALNMVGARTNAKQYLIGNPLTAIQMSQHDIRAALYAPLRVLVYEQREGHTIVEYDQPSSQFGQFGLTDVTQVAMTLDVKLERVLVQAAELSR